jgi:DNA polymerase II small subunit/DNA polymerase delta subunit B
MDKREVYSKFIGKGISLDPASLDFFAVNSDMIPTFLESAGKKMASGSKLPSIVTLEYARGMVGTGIEAERPEEIGLKKDEPIPPQGQPEPANQPFRPIPSIIKRYLMRPSKHSFTTDDILSISMSYYEKARGLIATKLPSNTVSINKIQPQGRLSLIAMVASKSYDECSMIVQDATGEVTVRMAEKKELESIMEGDVVGLGCENGPDGLVASVVVYPDVSMKRKIETPAQESFVLFSPVLPTTGVQNLLKWIEGFEGKDKLNVVIIAGMETIDGLEHYEQISGSVGREHVISASDPSMMSFDGVKVLACPGRIFKEYDGVWGSAENVLVNVLKRRDLVPGVTVGDSRAVMEKTFFDETPDIFVTNLPGASGNPSSSNYKGVSIINAVSSESSATIFVANLKTRVVNKFDLRYE